ncbi:heme-binding protein [Marinobacter halodurans]|uniref:Heme-binding protein n=2 Tax=Marinobacter halodurans TaxID=2528979 RepID=A0ABY1ZEF0_9GAMM|nr:heme-binding protein [Marinobacter halodurans]
MRVRIELEESDVENIMEAACNEAMTNLWPVSIAIVDEGGHLLAFRRLQNASKSSVQIAIDKARSAALTQRPTSFFEDMFRSGRPAASLHGVIPMTGGLPIMFEGQLVGGIAASGVKSEFDVQVAQAGLNFLR